jgi:hypothetical protein
MVATPHPPVSWWSSHRGLVAARRLVGHQAMLAARLLVVLPWCIVAGHVFDEMAGWTELKFQCNS